MLVETFLRRFNQELGRQVREVDPEALARLVAYSWPGNVRQLQSVLKQALLQATGTTLLPAFLPPELTPQGPTDKAGATAFLPQCATLADLERGAIQECLAKTMGNRQQTADLLGISTRTLLRKIRIYKLQDPCGPPTPIAKKLRRSLLRRPVLRRPLRPAAKLSDAAGPPPKCRSRAKPP